MSERDVIVCPSQGLMQAGKPTGGKRGRAPGVTEKALTFAFDYLQLLALVPLVL